MSSTRQVDEAMALGFQTRRFACDRCHRHKLRCEREPILTGAGISLPFGPCKRCGKAGVSCTTGNAPATKRRQEREGTEWSAATQESDGVGTDTNNGAGGGGQNEQIRLPNSLRQNVLDGISQSDMSLFNPDVNLSLDSFDFNISFGDGDGHLTVGPSLHTTSGAETSPNASGLFNGTGGSDPATLACQSNLGSSTEVSDCPVAQPIDIPNGGRINGTTAGAEPGLGASSENEAMIDALNRDFDRISHLHTYIFREFRFISAESFKTIFLLPSTSGPNDNAYNNGEYSSVVTQLVYASERMLEIMGSCQKPEIVLPFAGSPPSSKSHQSNIPASKLSYSASLQNKELTSRPNSRDRRWTDDDGGSRQAKILKHSGPDGPLYPGLASPVKMSWFTCYVTILSVCRIILNKAFEALQGQASSNSAPGSTSSPLPYAGSRSASTQPNNTQIQQLSGADILGVRIQLEVLTHLLERFDDSWAAILARAKEFEGGIHLDGMQDDLKLLRHMLVHEGFECEADDHAGVGPLMHLVKRIKWMLRTCSSSGS